MRQMRDAKSSGRNCWRPAPSKPVTAETAKAFLRDAENNKAEVKTLRSRTGMVKRETEKIVLFEARDNVWGHRNYLAK
jgi:hypothetical protein